MYSFGTSAHPAAGVCKTLTTGGYNTWYLPAQNELLTVISNKSKTPFSTSDGFVSGGYWWASTEYNNNNGVMVGCNSGVLTYGGKSTANFVYTRAVRRSTV